jgi:hypothetical protein
MEMEWKRYIASTIDMAEKNAFERCTGDMEMISGVLFGIGCSTVVSYLVPQPDRRRRYD